MLTTSSPAGGKWLTSEAEVNHRIADRLRTLQGAMKHVEFARKCGIRETLMRKYLDGSMPGADKLAKIALANHVSIDWLAIGRGPQSYDELRQPRHEDYIRAGYLQDSAAAGRVHQRQADHMPLLKAARVTLDEFAALLKVKVPPDWDALLVGLLAEEQLTPIGARRILEELKRAQ